MDDQSRKKLLRKLFTDRDHGKGFVLSAFRTASGATKRKHIITYRIHTTCNGCMEGELLGMC
jgi:hypothetical protein